MPGTLVAVGRNSPRMPSGSVRLGVERFLLRRAAGHEEQDARLRRATGPRQGADRLTGLRDGCSHTRWPSPSPTGDSTPACKKARRFTVYSLPLPGLVEHSRVGKSRFPGKLFPGQPESANSTPPRSMSRAALIRHRSRSARQELPHPAEPTGPLSSRPAAWGRGRKAGRRPGQDEPGTAPSAPTPWPSPDTPPGSLPPAAARHPRSG